MVIAAADVKPAMTGTDMKSITNPMKILLNKINIKKNSHGLTQSKYSQKCNYYSCHETQEYSKLRPFVVRMLRGHERHDGRGTHGDILGAAEYAVNEATHEGRVETIL